MKIIAISDLHGHLIDIPECDLLLIAGDIVDLQAQSHYVKSRNWWLNEFQTWLDNLPCEKVLFIGGNHDMYLAGEDVRPRFNDSNKATYLCDTSYTYTKDGKSVTVYGTPWCKIFGNWWFMRSDDKLTELFNRIPDNIDILLTHDAPYGVNDVCLQRVSWNTGEHIGNKPLRDAILLKKPKINIHGHLHTTLHNWECLGDTKVINVSILDERYNVVYEPTIIDEKEIFVS